MPQRNVSLVIRAVGARNAAREVDATSSSVRRLGASSRGTVSAMRGLTVASDRMQASFRQVRTWGVRAAFGVGAIGIATAKVGIQFNAVMEQQRVAFTGFLGSTRAAQVYLQRLYDLAAKTPFEFQDVVRGTRTLIAYGLSAKNAYGTIKDLGNAIAAVGGGAEQIQAATTALGQIQAAGVLHAQDLNQLIQAGVVSIPRLSQQMGLSTSSFRMAMQAGDISAQRFFRAMRFGWTHDPMYKGAATRQAKTFYGQLSTLHDFSVQALGSITKPLFDALERDGLPRMTRFVKAINLIWQNVQLPLADRLRLTSQEIQRHLAPIGVAIKQWWRVNHVGETLVTLFNQAVSRLPGIIAVLGLTTARAFWRAFWSVNWVGKSVIGGVALIMAGRLLTFLGGVVGAAGTLVGKGLGGKLGGRPGVVPVFVTNPGFGGKMPGKESGPGKVAKTAAKAVVAARAVGPYAGPLGAIAFQTWFWNKVAKHNFPAGPGGAARQREAAGTVPFDPQAINRRSMTTAPVYRAPALPQPTTALPHRTPAPAPSRPAPAPWRPLGDTPNRIGEWHGDTVIPLTVELDGRPLAHTVHREAIKKRSTR